MDGPHISKYLRISSPASTFARTPRLPPRCFCVYIVRINALSIRRLSFSAAIQFAALDSRPPTLNILRMRPSYLNGLVWSLPRPSHLRLPRLEEKEATEGTMLESTHSSQSICPYLSLVALLHDPRLSLACAGTGCACDTKSYACRRSSPILLGLLILTLDRPLRTQASARKCLSSFLEGVSPGPPPIKPSRKMPGQPSGRLPAYESAHPM